MLCVNQKRAIEILRKHDLTLISLRMSIHSNRYCTKYCRSDGQKRKLDALKADLVLAGLAPATKPTRR